jgi:hypothetical protein
MRKSFWHPGRLSTPMKKKTWISFGLSEVHTIKICSNSVGGGGNFGVVTEFTFKVFPHAYPSWQGVLVYGPDQLDDVSQAFDKYLKSQNDPKAMCAIGVTCLPPSFDPVIGIIAFYDGSEEQGRKCYKPFFDIKPIADRTEVRKTYLELVCCFEDIS